MSSASSVRVVFYLGADKMNYKNQWPPAKLSKQSEKYDYTTDDNISTTITKPPSNIENFNVSRTKKINNKEEKSCPFTWFPCLYW
jgi:hypothetical protein